MAKGVIDSVYPPNNDGSRHGAGQIDKKDDAGQPTGEMFTFQTPQGCTPPISVGLNVAFTESEHGKLATDVVEDTDPPPPGGGGE